MSIKICLHLWNLSKILRQKIFPVKKSWENFSAEKMSPLSGFRSISSSKLYDTNIYEWKIKKTIPTTFRGTRRSFLWWRINNKERQTRIEEKIERRKNSLVRNLYCVTITTSFKWRFLMCYASMVLLPLLFHSVHDLGHRKKDRPQAKPFETLSN